MRNYKKELEWEKKKYKRLTIKVNKNDGEEFERCLKNNGENISGHFKIYIKKYLEKIK